MARRRQADEDGEIVGCPPRREKKQPIPTAREFQVPKLTLSDRQEILKRRPRPRCLLPGNPAARVGFPILCNEKGQPVIVKRPDLKPNEVNFVLR